MARSSYSNYSIYKPYRSFGVARKEQENRQKKIIEELKKNFEWEQIKRELEREDERDRERQQSFSNPTYVIDRGSYPSSPIPSYTYVSAPSWWYERNIPQPVKPEIEEAEDVDFSE